MPKLLNQLQFPLTFADLQKLFIGIVAPTHFWAIIVFFNNAPNPKTAHQWYELFAILAYILIIVFFESVVIFVVTALMVYLLPRNWPGSKSASVLLILVYIVFFWAGLSQLLHVLPIPAVDPIIWLSINLNNTFIYRQIAWYGSFVAAGLLVGAQALLVFRRTKTDWIDTFVERLAVLSYLYLLFDVFSLIYILFRNVQ